MYNRGFRRDDNSFRSNVNMSRGHNAPSLMSVSPWEGGVVPGSGSSSILGAPNMQSLNNSNLISPQAAALAQNLNLLSNLGLFQSQLQSRQPQGLPSLVSMASNLNRSMGPQPNYRQVNQPMNRGMNNRFQDQRPKYGRQDGRRVEPFNKNRPRTSQSQNSQQKLQSYRPLNSKVPPQQAARKPASQGANSNFKNRGDMKGKRGFFKKDAKKADAAVKVVVEESKKDEGEEPTTKRDWKTEKKSDVVVVEDDSDEPKTEVKVEVKEDEAEVEQANGEEIAEKMETDSPEGEKDTEPSENEDKGKTVKDGNKRTAFFNCHVCSKNIWDERSLNNHVRTAAHKRMMAELEESYSLKVKRLRMQMRSLEDQKDGEKFRGRGRRVDMSNRGHCKMCDLTFQGNIANHRKTALHLKLKSFLHPNCVPCGKEFPARMEWDMHKLTPAHCKVMAALEKRRKSTNQDRRSEPNYARLVPKFPQGLDSAVADMIAEEADKAAASDTEEKGEDGEPKKNALRYDPAVPSGLNMLVHGQHCGVCNKFFIKRGDAVEHCKTRSHFDNYLVMKAKVQEAAAEAARVAAEEAKLAAEQVAAAAVAEPQASTEPGDETAVTATDVTASEGLTCPDAETKPAAEMIPVLCLKRSSAGTEEGNWKRRRASKKDDDDEEEEEETNGLNSSELTEELQKEGPLVTKTDVTNVDKYDPLEPTPPSPLETSLEMLQAVEDAIDSVESEVEPQSDSVTESPTVKPANKARRGRKRK